MNDRHVIVGAGPVGLATARELSAAGHEVLLVSRSGTGPALPGVRREAADAADPDSPAELAQGAVALYNCINPPSYDVWPTYWPPVAAAFLAAAERSGAVLVTASCLYGYGPVEGPMVEGTPDLAPGVKGRLRSDYLGPDVTGAHIPVVVPRALTGKAVRVFGDPHLPHSFTDVRDMGRALAAVATTASAWGRVWHAPTNAPRTQAETVADVCRAAGREPVPVRAWPKALLSLGGVFVPMLREMRETVYQFQRPYVLDSTAITRELGLEPTPWAEVCRATAEGSQPRRSPQAVGRPSAR